mmetsp:Transcript_1976/g.5920  ORF Transcript_1976/g.5920 Transcript_1976/m.5920 type:complete len:108 (+) Transcript_1976:34-357(+)
MSSSGKAFYFDYAESGDLERDERGQPVVDFKKPEAVARAREAHVRETLIEWAEMKHLQTEMLKCYYREGQNHIQKCRKLTKMYEEKLQTYDRWFLTKANHARESESS